MIGTSFGGAWYNADIFLSVNKLVFPVHTLAGLEACVAPIQVPEHDKNFSSKLKTV